MKDVFDTADMIHGFGYWFTYHQLTHTYDMPRGQALWMMWVARQYMLHRDGRSLVHRFVDKFI